METTDRRIALRIQPPLACARILHPDGLSFYTIEDLSQGGVRLSGTRGLCVGTRVTVELLLHGATPLKLRGRVLRKSSVLGAEIVVGFDRAAAIAPLFDADRGTIAAARPTHLIAHPDPVTAGIFLRMLRGLGRVGRWAPTALDAVNWLERAPMSVACVAPEFGGGGPEFGRFLRDLHPKVRRILLLRSQDRLDELGVEPGSFHAVLRSPFAREDVQFVVGDGAFAGSPSQDAAEYGNRVAWEPRVALPVA